MQPSECVFCRIIAGNLPATIYYRDELVTAFQDTHPLAPVHILVIPNKHLDSINTAGVEDEALLGHMLLVARQMAQEQGIDQRGYRLVMNTGRDGGQSVHHMHLHMLGGARLRFNFDILEG